MHKIYAQTFGIWSVLEPIKRAAQRVRCRCQCGTERYVLVSNMLSGQSKSCGCRREGRAKHGMHHSVEYGTWTRMLSRCRSVKGKNFKDYAGRGIRVCERWHVFENFLADMGPRPSDSHSIERKNNDGDYEPANCVWATRTQQMRNRRNTKLVEYQGELVPTRAIDELLGLRPGTTAERIRRGWSQDTAVKNQRPLRRQLERA